MVITNLNTFVCEFVLTHADFRILIKFFDVLPKTLVPQVERAVYNASRHSTSSTVQRPAVRQTVGCYWPTANIGAVTHCRWQV
jgi:hypothetical protein